MQTETGDQCMRDVPDPADWRDRSDGTEGGVFSEGSGNWWFDENGLNTGWSEERDGEPIFKRNTAGINRSISNLQKIKVRTRGLRLLIL